ncbi:MAG: hypothetical protein IT531_00215 [Burkholderiales bacterium]|nr:hypothetical protein [Burkholderiales bacterium]
MDRIQVELRGHVDKDIIDVIDAVSIARDVTRIDVVEEVLRRWADERVKEAKLMNRLVRREGSSPERA